MKLEEEIKSSGFKDPFERLIVNVIYSGNWLNHLINKLLKPYGISPQQYNILRILRGQHPSPATLNLLNSRMLDKMSNTSRLVEKLRAKELVERHICPNDRRAVDILITEKGLQLLKTIDGKMKSFRKEIKRLNEEEITILNDLLDKLRG